MRRAGRALRCALFLAVVCACATPVKLASHDERNRPLSLTAYLSMPSQAGPVPAVVLMHGCAGINMGKATLTWDRWFVAHGIATLEVDSFTGRGWGYVCTNPTYVTETGSRWRLPDAQAALDYLRGLPGIDKDRIVLMGFSHGAATALLAQGTPRLAYNAFIAVYPYCGGGPRAIAYTTPTLILIGAKDDWTPAQLCEDLFDARRAIVDAGLELRVYPDAYHAFDSPAGPFFVQGCCTNGGTKTRFAGYDAYAYRQSRIDVAEFLNRRLALTIVSD